MRKFITMLGAIVLALAGCAPAASSVPTSTPVPPISSPTSTLFPTSTPFNPSVEVTGQPEVVFDWATQRCSDDEHPDLPVRAFRDANNMIQMTIASPTNYRLIGPDLDSLKPDCNPVLLSANDRDPSHYNTWDWIGSTYTLDGNTIYAIIHNEYHADQVGSIWQADQDFSDTQGTHDWSYQAWTGTKYIDMNFDTANNRWQGFMPLCQIGDSGMHPDLGCEPSRTWTSPIDGTVTVNGRVYDENSGGGNGVAVGIYKGDEQIWSATIDNGDTVGQSYDLKVDVQKGDQLHFRVNARGDNGWDSTFFNPGINIGPAPCPSMNHSQCSLLSLAFAVSTDGGKTYTEPAAPANILANLPYKYEPGAMRAIWQPSGIVKSPVDGYYYALIQIDEHGPAAGVNLQGSCAIRTQDLSDPASWRAWDGSGFNMTFIDPYTDTGADPSQHTCTPVSLDTLGGLTYGLSYNNYFDKYLAIGVRSDGFYYSLSDDMVNWTPVQLIMKAVQSFGAGGFPYYPYPTLIDPDSPSRNYDVTGQTPYLYYSRVNSSSPFSVDLMRVRIQFSK
jgi:hypothetical protein